MKRLLEDFDRLFDLGHRIDGRPLRDLLREAIADLDARPRPDWGVPGDRARSQQESKGASVRFRYLPHLFPGMDLKLRLAHKLQFHLLPWDPPAGGPVTVSAVLESYCHLSGDLFGWETLRDGRFLLWIVDMSGHGVRSGLASAILRVIVAHVRERGDLPKLVGRLNEALCASTRRDGTSVFATGCFLTIDADGRGEYVSAGHPPGLVRGVDGSVRPLESTSLPIGMFPETVYEACPARLAPGELLLLATDGLFEMQNAEGEAYGVDRLREFLRSRPFRRTTALADALYRASGAWMDLDHLDDDLSFVVARLDR